MSERVRGFGTGAEAACEPVSGVAIVKYFGVWDEAVAATGKQIDAVNG